MIGNCGCGVIFVPDVPVPPEVVIEIAAAVQHEELTTKVRDVLLSTLNVATGVEPICTEVAPEKSVPVTRTVEP